MNNVDIREMAEKSKVKLWRIADYLGITDGNFSRKLRKELPEAEKQKIITAINELATENSNKDN